MKSFGLATLGRDVEVRNTASGLVANLSLAFTYGRKGEDGKRPTQWVKATMWGDNLIDALEQYLTKGTKIAVSLRDVHIATFVKADGSTGTSLEATIVDLDLAQVAERQDGQQQAPQQAPRQQAPQQRPQQGQAPQQRPYGNAPQQPQRQAPQNSQGGANSGFDDMDDDIPFATANPHYDMTTSKARRMARRG